MAMLFRFRAMTQQSNCALLRQLLKQAQCEFLAVVFDRAISLVHRPAFKKFLAIAASELAPADLVGQDRAQQLLGWTKIRHPDVVGGSRQAPAAESRRQNAQSILARFNDLAKFRSGGR